MLEDGGSQGSAGAHFEKVDFANETMVSDDTRDAVFSKMTLAVTKDSGWYEIDLGKGDHYEWGKGEGCGILDGTCSHATKDEFCSSSGGSMCTKSMLHKSSCHSSQFTGQCKINLQHSWCKEESGENHLGYRGHDALCSDYEVIFF